MSTCSIQVYDVGSVFFRANDGEFAFSDIKKYLCTMMGETASIIPGVKVLLKVILKKAKEAY